MSEIFVFGSNLGGRHGKGAALHAWKHHGAIRGQGVGMQGSCYAIPTKDANLKTLPLPIIETYVEQFKLVASNNPELTFKLTEIGCGLAGYIPENIAPMFKDSPENVIIPKAFRKVLNEI